VFISRKHYDDLRLEWAKNHEEARVLSDQNRMLQTTLDWMRVRMTQVETERAQMLFTFTGVKIAVPTIERETPPGPHRGNVSDILAAVNHFGDVGDTEAAQLGVQWNPDGTLRFQD
jgi:hypothetical protein